ncbi:MAG: FAD:protein FMN transferase [Mariprofundaceae bacterium]
MVLKLLLLLLLAGCSGTDREDVVRETRFIMGTFVTFTIVDLPKNKAIAAIAAAEKEMRRIEALFTIDGDKISPVQQFNQLAVGSTILLPAEVSALLQQSLAIEKASHHSFSPLLGGLIQLWGFSKSELPIQPPDGKAIQRQRVAAHTKWIRQNNKGWQRLHHLLQLDFGAIAKGYAIDQGIAALKKHHVQNAILEAGGDLRVLGAKHGKPWRIGIRHPREKGGVLGWVELQGDHSIVTSGDYERFFVWEGQRFHHIFDPETGRPANIAQSATVIAKDATLADAWSTALFVSGERGLKAVEKANLDGMWVDQNGEMHLTEGMRQKFHPKSQH